MPALSLESLRKVYVHTFGCQMNEYDSDKILEVLRHENFAAASSYEDADLIILNTCSVREKAEQKVYSLLGRLRKLKEKHPQLLIGVGGCVAQQEGKQLLKNTKVVDLVFGTDNLFDLPMMLKEVSKGKRVLQIERKAEKQKVRNFIPEKVLEHHSSVPVKSHLAITKGCNNHCAFCIVPITRGFEVSRESDNIVEEARKLVSLGTKEICLLGQNVNSYKANGVNFVSLLEHLNEIEGLERIRFTSPHPKDFRADLAHAIAKLDSVCEQLHLPLQSGSNTILKKMRRHYTLEAYEEKVELLKTHVPHAALSTDMIVGFPGETDADFQKTMDAIHKFRYEQIYAFKFSPRPGTPASTDEAQVEESLKSERLQILLEAQKEIQSETYKSLLHTQQEVLVESEHPRTPEHLIGRSRGNHSVVVMNHVAPAGTLLPVLISGARNHTLEATLL